MPDITRLIYNHTNAAEIEGLLLGHRIVAVEKGEYELEGRRWYDSPTGRLTLDDGTQLYVAPNQGGCACSAGDYTLTHLTKVDNVITSVRLVDEEIVDGEDAHSYRIYVVADAQEINAVQVDGDDGNGYYGTGYELIVVPARGDTHD